tara:strand:+ start:479 stop:1351 length:873 start_codon:yes stop_codon:yes gene_type:complete
MPSHTQSFGEKQLLKEIDREKRLADQLKEEQERLVSAGASDFDIAEFARQGAGLLRSVQMSQEDSDALSQPLADAVNPEEEQAAREAAEKEERDYNRKRNLENRNERISLRKRLTDAMNLSVEEGREERLAEIKDEGINDLGIDQQAMTREVLEERSRIGREFGEKVRAQRDAKQKADYDAFFARANDPNRTLGVGSRRTVYSRNAGLRKARKLRRMGFTKAAEQAAEDWARSAESDAPAISTPAMRAKQAQDASRLQEVRESNRRLQQLLLQRGIKQVDEDPDFKPFNR